MSVRPVRVTEFPGAAAAAVRSARGGEAVDVTSRGEVVARIVPVTDEETTMGGMRVIGTGRGFKSRIPQVVIRISPGSVSGADHVIADRDR